MIYYSNMDRLEITREYNFNEEEPFNYTKDKIENIPHKEFFFKVVIGLVKVSITKGDGAIETKDYIAAEFDTINLEEYIEIKIEQQVESKIEYTLIR